MIIPRWPEKSWTASRRHGWHRAVTPASGGEARRLRAAAMLVLLGLASCGDRGGEQPTGISPEPGGIARATTESTPTVQGISLDPGTVVAGSTSLGTVVLSSAAPEGGTAVGLMSSKTSVATVPPSVTVAAGGTSATFTVTTHAVASQDWAAISANAGGVTQTATLWVTPAGLTLDSLTIQPTLIASGETAQGTVKLTGAAPEGGASVTLSSTDVSRATVPSSVTVPAGATLAGFAVTAQPVTPETEGGVYISAAYGGVTRTVRMYIDSPPPAAGELSSLTISPDLVVGGESAQGTVALGAATDVDTEVTLASSDVSVATVPASVIVPAGATTAAFTVSTLVNSTGTGQFAEISGQAGGVTRSATITTTAPPSGPSASSLGIFPASLGGGGPATGILTFDGTLDDGVLLNYTVSHPEVVTIQNFLLNGPAGENEPPRFWSSTQRAFGVRTGTVGSDVIVTITAHACCGARGQATAELRVTTGPPPAADRVDIERARWQPGGTGGTLTVRAKSSSTTALLSVYIAGTDRFLMVLNPVGSGIYEGQQSFGGGMTNPETIDVRSNLGGSDRERVRS